MTQLQCRLCLTKPPVYFSVLENRIHHMLEALTFMKVTSNDDLPTIICLKCLLSLKLAYNFQQRIKSNQQSLREKIRIKEEIVEEQNPDLVTLCDTNCAICGAALHENLINDHIREHFNNQQNCAFCDKIFSNIQSYREHLYEHPEREMHECEICSAKFQYKSFYDLHAQTACCLEKPTKQRIARLGLSSKQAIARLTVSKRKAQHKINASFGNIGDEDSRRKIFALGLRSSSAIKILMRQNEKEEMEVCKICSKKFTKKSFQNHTHETRTCSYCHRDVSKYGFKKHVEDHILGPQVCHFCGATLQNRSCLAAHIFYSHNAMRYKCEQCGRVFQKKNARDAHVQKQHIGTHTHHCDTCGKGFFTKRYLQQHVKTKHLKMRPHVCEFCQKGFSSRYALKTHRRQHTNETPYRCEICGDGFRQNVSLRAHRKSKHGIVEEEVCKCKVCDKGFASDSALHAHMRLHQ